MELYKIKWHFIGTKDINTYKVKSTTPERAKEFFNYMFDPKKIEIVDISVTTEQHTDRYVISY